MWKMMVVLGMFFACVPIGAQTLQKCIGKGGAVAFRSGPCEPGEKLADQRDGNSDMRTPEQWRALRERQARDRAGSQYLSHVAGTDDSRVTYRAPGKRNQRVVRCEAAKKKRDAAIRRL